MPKDTKSLILVLILLFKRTPPSRPGFIFVDFWKQKEDKTEYKSCKLELSDDHFVY